MARAFCSSPAVACAVRTLRALPSRLKSAWVFPSETGETPLDGQNFVNRVFVKALTKAKIEDFSWHCLRHTFASRLVMAGVDLRTVQELMGHKTLAMTLRYSHLSLGHQLDAVQRLNAAAHRVVTPEVTPTLRHRKRLQRSPGKWSNCRTILVAARGVEPRT